MRKIALLSILLICAVAPAAAPAPAESFIRVTLTLPLRPLLDSLERALPGDTVVRSRWEAVEDGVEMRWLATRESLRVGPRRDTLLATSRVAYRVEARGQGFGEVACGGGARPLEAVVGVLARLGWRDDWGLECRSIPLASAHSERCKPKPPGVNFTEVLAPRLDAAFHPRMGTALDSLVARDRRPRALVQAIWDALLAPVPTRLPGLVVDVAPRRVLAGALLATEDRVTAELAVAVSPRLLWDESAAHRLDPLPENRVRIAGEVLEVGFDAEARFDSLRARALARCAAHPQAHGPYQPLDLRLSRAGDGLAVEVRTRGARTLRLRGGAAYDGTRHRLGVAALEPTRGLGRGSERGLESLRECLAEGLQQDLTDWLVTTSAQAGRALNQPLAPGVRIEGGIFERRADHVAVGAAGIQARMVAVGKARIFAEPAP